MCGYCRKKNYPPRNDLDKNKVVLMFFSQLGDLKIHISFVDMILTRPGFDQAGWRRDEVVVMETVSSNVWGRVGLEMLRCI